MFVDGRYGPIKIRRYSGPSEAYDGAKVSRMTQLLIETVAEYGHRMEHLPNSERLLIILEAPRDRISIQTRVVERVQDVKREIRDREERVERSREMASETRRRDRELRAKAEAFEEEINEREAEINALEGESKKEAEVGLVEAKREESLERLLGQAERAMEIQKRLTREHAAKGQRRILGDIPVLGTFFRGSVVSSSSRDKLLLSFKKSDLTKGTEYDRLKNKVEQTLY